MKGRIIAAIVLLVIGVAWILDLQGRAIFPGGWGVWWPTVIILVGIVQLVSALPARSDWRPPVILILVGTVFQAWRLGYFPRVVWAYVAPVALIVVAVFLLLPLRKRGTRTADAAPARGVGGPEDVAIFGERRFEAPAGQSYAGGEMTALFGALEADLRRATLPSEGARLKATSVFGGVRVNVPADWTVEVAGRPVFGRVDDRTRGAADGPRLRVEAVALFGSVDISN